MREWIDDLKKMSSDLSFLIEDISKIIAAKKKETKSDEKGNIKSANVSTKSLRRTTTLYKSEKEAVEAQKDPDKDFIIQKAMDIFK